MSTKRTPWWADPDTKAAFLTRRALSPGYSSPLRGERIAAAARVRWADPEYAARMRAAMADARAKAPPRGKRITVNGVLYSSLTAAREATGLSLKKLRQLLKEAQ